MEPTEQSSKSDRPAIDDLLGSAYMADQVDRDRPKAVQIIRDALSEAAVAGALRARHAEMSQVIGARSFAGGRSGCHVTSTIVSLLTEALK